MKRRRFLADLSAGAVGSSLATLGMSSAQAEERKSTFVFVHGAWFGGWCWSEVVRLLAQQGHNAVAVDLPGHGISARFPAAYLTTPQSPASLSTEVSPLATITLRDYRDHVLRIINGLVGKGSGPVILVGHSLGGVTLNAVAEAEPSLIRRLVYLTAFAPVRKPSVLDYLSQPNFVASKLLPLFLGDPSRLGAARINPNSNDPTYTSNAKNALFQDATENAVAATLNLMTPDEPLHGLADDATVTTGRWGSVPRAYIRCTNDNAIPLAGQDQMIAEGDELTPRNRYIQKCIDSSHSVFLSHADEVTQVLLQIV